MNDVALIVVSKSDYYLSSINECDIIPLFNNKSAFMMHLYRIFPFFAYNKLKRSISKHSYKTIIVFDAVLIYFNKIEKIINKFPSIVFNMYVWNMIENNKNVLVKKDYFSKVFSISKLDCGRYDLRHLNLMAHPIKQKSIQPQTDFYFLGFAKKRRKAILDLAEILKTHNSKFVIISDENKKQGNVIFTNVIVNYQDYIDNLISTKCIIDICNPGQDGYTLRVAESIVYEKKLLTTNKEIKEEKFFNENNILVFDENTTVEEIECFMNKPYIKLNDRESSFIFSNWLKEITK